MNIDTNSETQKPDVIKFLLGEGQLDGMDYGDKQRGVPPYWWRIELRKQFESLQSENQRLTEENRSLKENYEGMKSHCGHLTQINVVNMAFDKADEAWREQHKVEDGEDFIHWFMRLHAVEKDDLKIERDRLTKINEELVKALTEYTSAFSGEDQFKSDMRGFFFGRFQEIIEKSANP